ncbi:MAG: hypothetical protein WBA74_03890, partial [Cyclobacteriaceae bacterium]
MLKNLKAFLWWLVGTTIVIFLIITVLFLFRGGEWSRIPDLYAYLMNTFLVNPLFYLFVPIPYLVFRFACYLHTVYKRKGWQTAVQKVVLTAILPLLILFGAFRTLAWYNSQENFAYEWDSSVENLTGKNSGNYRIDGKHRGIHVFLRSDVEAEVALLVKHNVEWMTLVPYASQDNVLEPSLRFRKRVAYNRRDSSFIRQIKIAKENGLHVLMKPHIWTTGDLWRSEIEMSTDANWDQWFEQYENFILHYAVMAESTGCEALCIGTELMKPAIMRPTDWRKLIKKVREVYSGKLIYAANWYKEYEQITFWDELDYIGIQAYFGLSDASVPTVAQLEKSWKPHKARLLEFHEKWQNPVLFTEVGYKSVRGAAHKPWEWESYTGLTEKVSMETQANCYEALFRVFWDEPWFAGVHLWRWQGEARF